MAQMRDSHVQCVRLKSSVIVNQDMNFKISEIWPDFKLSWIALLLLLSVVSHKIHRNEWVKGIEHLR